MIQNQPLKIYNKMQHDVKRKPGPQLQALHIRHILPKANQIAYTSQENIKSIYPFELVPAKPNDRFETSIPSFCYQNKNIRNKFMPPKSTVLQHFKACQLIYAKFAQSAQMKISAMNIYSIEKLKALSKNDFILSVPKSNPYISEHHKLQFDSRFQCGNLDFASECQGIYCLLLHNDVNTTGYTNWFYFSVKNRTESKIKGKFAIMNYGKAGWPVNIFPGICLWSQKKCFWQRKHGNACCQKNTNLYTSNKDFDNFNTLYFEYQLEPNEKVFFAYNPPYTYTDLLKSLDTISQQKYKFFHRKLAGTTLIGNRLEMLSIANFEMMRKTGMDYPVIVILARTHAGQTVSSWIMHHFIQFLISDEPEAAALRDSFIFKIFPMVNPDGVVHGNYRCSLIGRDLNRRWKNPSKELYPEVYYIKNQILDTHEQKQIKMIIDLHGHTQKRRAFFYGCTDRTAPHKTRLFPYLVSKISSIFDFSSCNFAMERSKQSTARITLYNVIKAPEIFTLQTSQFGVGDRFLSSQVFEDIAVSLCRGISRMYRVNRVGIVRGIQNIVDEDHDKNNTTTCKSSENAKEKQLEDFEEELLSNPNLLKIGCEPSDGSDSQPSVCNLQFDKINKLAMQSQPRPVTTQPSPKRRLFLRPQTSTKPRIKRQSAMSINISREMNQKMSQMGFDKLKDRGLSPLRGGSSMSHKRTNIKSLRPQKLQLNNPIQSIPKIKDCMEDRVPVRMINFELLIDESGSRKSSFRDNIDRSDLKVHHLNYHMIQKRWGFGTRGAHWNKSSV